MYTHIALERCPQNSLIVCWRNEVPPSQKWGLRPTGIGALTLRRPMSLRCLVLLIGFLGELKRFGNMVLLQSWVISCTPPLVSLALQRPIAIAAPAAMFWMSLGPPLSALPLRDRRQLPWMHSDSAGRKIEPADNLDRQGIGSATSLGNIMQVSKYTNEYTGRHTCKKKPIVQCP